MLCVNESIDVVTNYTFVGLVEFRAKIFSTYAWHIIKHRQIKIYKAHVTPLSRIRRKGNYVREIMENLKVKLKGQFMIIYEFFFNIYECGKAEMLWTNRIKFAVIVFWTYKSASKVYVIVACPLDRYRWEFCQVVSSFYSRHATRTQVRRPSSVRQWK